MSNFLASVSAVGLVAVATAALADDPMRLSPAQMDQVTAGEARATIDASGSIAIGPNKARTSASGLAIGSTSASVMTTLAASKTSTPGHLETVQSASSDAVAR